jgi:hypothetical protein
MEAETQKTTSEKEHERCAAVFTAAKQKVISIRTRSGLRLTDFGWNVAVSNVGEGPEERNPEISLILRTEGRIPE